MQTKNCWRSKIQKKKIFLSVYRFICCQQQDLTFDAFYVLDQREISKVAKAIQWANSRQFGEQFQERADGCLWHRLFTYKSLAQDRSCKAEAWWSLIKWNSRRRWSKEICSRTCSDEVGQCGQSDAQHFVEGSNGKVRRRIAACR